MLYSMYLQVTTLLTIDGRTVILAMNYFRRESIAVIIIGRFGFESTKEVRRRSTIVVVVVRTGNDPLAASK